MILRTVLTICGSGEIYDAARFNGGGPTGVTVGRQFPYRRILNSAVYSTAGDELLTAVGIGIAGGRIGYTAGAESMAPVIFIGSDFTVLCRLFLIGIRNGFRIGAELTEIASHVPGGDIGFAGNIHRGTAAGNLGILDGIIDRTAGDQVSITGSHLARGNIDGVFLRIPIHFGRYRRVGAIYEGDRLLGICINHRMTGIGDIIQVRIRFTEECCVHRTAGNELSITVCNGAGTDSCAPSRFIGRLFRIRCVFHGRKSGLRIGTIRNLQFRANIISCHIGLCIIVCCHLFHGDRIVGINAVCHLDDTVVVGRCIGIFGGNRRCFCGIDITIAIMGIRNRPARGIAFIVTYGNGTRCVGCCFEAQSCSYICSIRSSC